MSILPKFRVQFNRGIGAEIYISFPDLTQNEQTSLSTDHASGVSSLAVLNGLEFAISEFILIGNVGSETSEIIQIHAATTPTASTITLASATNFSHAGGERVIFCNFNQAVIQRSTDSGSSYSDLVTISLRPDSTETYYNYTSSDGTDYFRVKYKNSDSGLETNPSDGIIATGYSEGTVGYLLGQVRAELRFQWGDSDYTQEIAMTQINDCLRHIEGKLKRFPQYLVPDYAVGQTSRGVFEFNLPSDIYDNETNKSILQVRLGSDTAPLVPLDEREFDNYMSTAVRSTVRVASASGSSTLAIVNSYDFDDAGAVTVYTSNVADAITYTGVTRSTTSGVLTGIAASGSSSIEYIHAVGTNVWQNEQEGKPKYFNVRNGSIRIYPLANATWINKNLYLDYHTQATAVDSLGDTIDTPRFIMVKWWLRWMAKNILRNNGTPDLNDGDYLLFREALSDLISKTVSNQKYKMKPHVNTIAYRNTNSQGFLID